MKLYYRPRTGRPLRVAWALEEIDADYEAVRVTTEETRLDEHLERHPLGRVPVLEDGDQVLFESTSLVLHLADRFPDAGLIPPLGDPGRALVYQWSIAAMTELERPISDIFLHYRANPEWVASATGRFATVAMVFERELEGRPFLVGERLTAADIVTGGVLALAAYADLLGELPVLDAYQQALRARPAFARAAERTESLIRVDG